MLGRWVILGKTGEVGLEEGSTTELSRRFIVMGGGAILRCSCIYESTPVEKHRK